VLADGPRAEPHGTTSPPAISVVITSYNHARFLGMAIESALAQTRAASEVIVVDDGSSDDSRSVAARYPSVRWIGQVNAGVAHSRNTGWRACRGEYVVFLDGDDRLLPHALEVGARCLQAHPECAFVFGHCQRIGPDGIPLPPQPWARVDRHHYRALLLDNYIWMPATVMYRRSALEAAGGFAPASDHACDYDLYLRLARTRPVFGHGEIVAEWRLHPSNVSNNALVMLRSTLRTYRRQKAHVETDLALREAYRRGRRFWTDRYGNEAVESLRGHLQRGEWRQAAAVMLTLLRYSPRVVLARGLRRLTRVTRARSENADVGNDR
jgi:glycosyltransferase involved in cell wall biosynthesis